MSHIMKVNSWLVDLWCSETARQTSGIEDSTPTKTDRVNKCCSLELLLALVVDCQPYQRV